ncbi:MAG: helix-turn-helix domain-containing protein [Polaromonas sp.]
MQHQKNINTSAPAQVRKQKFVDFNSFVLKIMGMSTNKSTQVHEDMHPADVIAALHKRGTSLRKIAIENGYSHIQRVLTSPWLAAEQLVAKALDRKPEDLWPSRYLNPADRALAFQLTRKIAVTMPHPRKQQPRNITADRTRPSWAEPDVNHG